MSKLINIAIAVVVVALGATLFLYLRPSGPPSSSQQAVDKWESQVQQNGDDPNNHANLAVAYMNNGQTDDAIREFNTALTQAPDEFVLMFKLGLAYEKKNDLDKALDEFGQAVDKYPQGEKGQVYYEMAQLEYNRSNNDQAKDDLQKALGDGDMTWNTHYLLGEILEQQGDSAGAKKEYTTAAQFNPDNQDLQAAIQRVS